MKNPNYYNLPVPGSGDGGNDGSSGDGNGGSTGADASWIKE